MSMTQKEWDNVLAEVRAVSEDNQRRSIKEDAKRELGSEPVEKLIKYIRKHKPIERLILIEAILESFCDICGRDHDDKYDRSCHKEGE